MNQWVSLLTDLPTIAQRLIARHQRISLPRNADATIRVARLRRALCRTVAVQAVYATLDPATQAALHALQSHYGGMAPDALQQQYGDVRAWSAMATDPQPRTIAEKLLLLGWLLPRAATPHHPARYLIPYELRIMLPAIAPLPTIGLAPITTTIPVLADALLALVAAAQGSLKCTPDGLPTSHALRELVPNRTETAMDALTFVFGLLDQLGLISHAQQSVRLTAAGQQFGSLPADHQLAQLRSAWIRQPDADQWIRPLRVNLHGIDWPCLRRRLIDRAESLPIQQICDPDTIAAELSARAGPLATANTHGFRPVPRTPWGPRKSAQVFGAALAGPLHWLGYVGWTTATESHPAGVFRRAPEFAHDTIGGSAWQYGDPGDLRIPLGANQPALLHLATYAASIALERTADSGDTLHIHLSPQRLAHVIASGQTLTMLQTLLETHAGPLPTAWHAFFAPHAELRFIDAVVLTGPDAALRRVTRLRSVRRTRFQRLARGVVVIPRTDVALLRRALQRAGLPVHGTSALADAIVPPAPPDSPPARALSPAELLAPGDWAALLAACQFYRHHAPADAALQIDEVTEQRLRAMLPARLLNALDQATHALATSLHPAPIPSSEYPPATSLPTSPASDPDVEGIQRNPAKTNNVHPDTRPLGVGMGG